MRYLTIFTWILFSLTYSLFSQADSAIIQYKKLKLSTKTAKSQADTLIGESKYEIIDRHSNGKVKHLGQYADDCNGQKRTKHGEFLTFKSNGILTKREHFFYDKKHNKKILGLRHGWWGSYVRQTKYFLGIKRFTVCVDPCF